MSRATPSALSTGCAWGTGCGTRGLHARPVAAQPSSRPPDTRPPDTRPRLPIRERKARLRARASAQANLFTLSEASAAGIGRSTVAGMVRSGEVVHQGRSVYRFAGPPLDLAGQALAYVLEAGRGAIASHALALALHGVNTRAVPMAWELTVRDTTPKVVDERVTVHRTTHLPRIDVMLVRSVPTTTGARTAVDVAGRLTVWERAALVDTLIGARVTTRGRVYGCARDLRAGRAGVSTLVALTRPGAEAWFRSWLERTMSELLAQFGLPPGEWNVTLSGAGAAGEVDLYFPEYHVVVELDGLRFHSDRRARVRDDAKGNAIALSGCLPLRFTWEDVVWRPAYVAGQIAQALGRPVPVAPDTLWTPTPLQAP